MKQLIFIPLGIGLSALLAYGFLRATGNPTHGRELIAALVPSVVAGMLALVPPLLQRQHGQAAVVQGAFHGMIAHMGGTVLVAVMMYLALNLKGPSTQPFAFWLMWFFAVTLVLVCNGLIRLIKSTSIAPAGLKNPQ
jgi:hypothetical protein